MYLFTLTSHNRLHKHQGNEAQSIPDQFLQSSSHRKIMSINNQCAIQQLSPTALAKQKASTVAECRSQDHSQSTDTHTHTHTHTHTKLNLPYTISRSIIAS